MATQDVSRTSPEGLYARMAQGAAVVVLDVCTEDALSVHPCQISDVSDLLFPVSECAI